MTEIEAWLYGSVARGTHSPRSDLDVLCVGDEAPSDGFLDQVSRGLPQRKYLAPKSYSWREIEGMASYGSLFLLHLKLEARPLNVDAGQSRLAPLLHDLPPYQLEKRDIAGFWDALNDVEWSLSDSGDIGFELAVIATIIRHCSILGCYKLGLAEFSTGRSVPVAFGAVGLASHASGALALYDFRLAESRGYDAPFMTPALAEEWLAIARQFVERTGELP